MIVPFLDGFLTFSKAPITWILLLINVFLFSQNYNLSRDCQEQFEHWYQDSDFIYTQGQVYRQFSKERQIASVQDLSTLGRLAFRDEGFLDRAPALPWRGDQVAIKNWRNEIAEFKVLRAYYPPMMLGVSQSQQDLFAFISYQFFHEGFLHLLGNLLLILIVGGFLERKHSGLTVFCVYVCGGAIAAFLYAQTTLLGGSPLVGASGSLCAMLGFLLSSEFKSKTRLFYIILPIKNYMGFVFVPTLYWILWLCMIEDVSGWLSQSKLLSSGVAHSVHLFGFFVGCLVGYAYLQLVKRKWITPRSHQA